MDQIAISAIDCPLATKYLCGLLLEGDNPKFHPDATSRMKSMPSGFFWFGDLRIQRQSVCPPPSNKNIKNMDQELDNHRGNTSLERGRWGDPVQELVHSNGGPNGAGLGRLCLGVGQIPSLDCGSAQWTERAGSLFSMVLGSALGGVLCPLIPLGSI